MPGGLEVSMLLVAIVVVFFAAVIRGYAGFGFSAMAIASLSILLPPAQIVPAILLVEIFAGITLVPSVWRHIDWRQLRWIFCGAIFATPLGLALLSGLSSQHMRAVISLLILGAAILIWLGVRIRAGDARTTIFAAGCVSGLMNGAAGVGGLPLVVFFLSKDEKAVTARATLITFLIALDIYTCLLAQAEGLITLEVIWLALVFLLPVSLGTLLGNRKFLKSPPESFRRIALAMLMLISGGGLARVLVQ